MPVREQELARKQLLQARERVPLQWTLASSRLRR
jgi:hypothetical protein